MHKSIIHFHCLSSDVYRKLNLTGFMCSKECEMRFLVLTIDINNDGPHVSTSSHCQKWIQNITNPIAAMR